MGIEIAADYSSKCPNQELRPNFAKIDTIVMHYTGTNNPSSVISWFNQVGSNRSAHYLIDKGGQIIRFVADERRAWHCEGHNAHSIGIEHVSEGEPMTPEQEAASVGLIRSLMGQHSIPIGGVTGHRFLGDNTECPSGLFGAATLEALTAWKEKHLGSDKSVA